MGGFFVFMEKENDIVVLWKTANVKIDNYFMFVIYYYYTNRKNKKENFYRCNIKIDTKENWLKLSEEIRKTNPAEFARTSMLGLDDNYRIIYSNRLFTRIDISKWIGSRFSDNRIITLDELKSNIENTKEPFPRTYEINGNEIDILETDSIPKGLWFSAYREKKKRKKYGRIIY